MVAYVMLSLAPYPQPPPTYIPDTPRVVIIGDIHGDLQRLVKCLYAAKLINTKLEWVAQPSNTVLVQLGDQVDSLNRGNPQEWERLADTEVMRFMEHVAKAAERGGGKVISMLGNHELMNVFGNFMYVSQTSMQKTGGVEGRTKLFQPGSDIATQLLAKRPIVLKVGDLLFCHGGLLPEHLYLTGGDLSRMNEIVYQVLLGVQLKPTDQDIFNRMVQHQDGIVWTRYYHENTDTDVEPVIDQVLNITKTKALFMGHTPHMRISSRANGKLWFCDTGISRSFGQNEYQILEVWNNGIPNPQNNHTPIRVITIQE